MKYFFNRSFITFIKKSMLGVAALYCMRVTGIRLGWIVVKNLEKAIKFYTEVVGLELFQHTPEMGWAELRGKDGAILGIAVENEDLEVKAGSNAIMCITVENMDLAISHYKEKGAKLIGNMIEITGHIKMQTFQDNDGNRFQLVSEI
jgi:predicted enzyme related to lactoylglutathione lyase